MLGNKGFMDNPVLDTEVEILKLQSGGFKFTARAVLKSASCAIPVIVLSEELVEKLKTDGQVFIEGIRGKVNGATDWGTTATITLETTATSPVTIATIATTGLDANVVVSTHQFTYGAGLGDLNAAGKGVQVKGDANGTGSDLIVTIWGVVK